MIIDWNRRENRNGIGSEEEENNLEEISLKDEGRGKIGREFKGDLDRKKVKWIQNKKWFN